MSQRRAKALRKLAGQQGITIAAPREYVAVLTKKVIGMRRNKETGATEKQYAIVRVSNKDRWMYQQMKKQIKEQKRQGVQNGKAKGNTTTTNTNA